MTKILRRLFSGSLLIGLLLPFSLYAGMVSSVSQYGITWTFDKEYEAGQFCNGDWWVKGPVTITDIDPKTEPASESPVDGSMLNPVPTKAHGLTVKYNGQVPYAAGKNISLQLPCAVGPYNSLVSTVNNPDSWSSDIAVEKTAFKEAAVLTVVDSVPAAGSFRPAYAGSLKTGWGFTTRDMNYGALQSLAAPDPAHVPVRDWLERATVRPLIEMDWSYLNSNLKASWHPDKTGGYPRRTYGREISHISSEAGLYLQLNEPDSVKEKLLVHMVQWGIDVYGLVKNGMSWIPNGGHQHGRMLPLFIAAKVLGDPDMLAACKAGPFQEINGHWFITQHDIDVVRTTSNCNYTQDQLGMPEWSSGGPYQRDQACADYWGGTQYRFNNSAPNCAAVAVYLLMDGRYDIGHEPYFRYIIDRGWPLSRAQARYTIPAYGDVPSLFTRDMWDAYAEDLSGIDDAVPVVLNAAPAAVTGRCFTISGVPAGNHDFGIFILETEHGPVKQIIIR